MMMLPAWTCSPPNFLRPRYWGLLVRPFLDEPTPFLCAMESAALRPAELDTGNPHIGELGAMSGLPAIVLPPLELEHVDLLALGFPDHLAGHGRPLHDRRAGNHRISIRGQQHLVKRELRARLGLQTRQPKGLALLGFELLSLGSDDGVHGPLVPW